MHFIGSGDAFGSGGRFQTCILLDGGLERVLLDCGASSLVGLKGAGIHPSTITTILITHLHGDHFGGIPFFLLDAQFSKRTDPLVIAGPPTIQRRVRDAQEVLFPNSCQTPQRFPIEFIEMQPEAFLQVQSSRVTAFPVIHSSGAPSHALRVEFGGCTITYSGDTEWTDRLAAAAAEADLFICEAYFFKKKVKYHLDYQTLAEHRLDLTCKRIIITHMSDDMLAHSDGLDIACAFDGLIISL